MTYWLADLQHDIPTPPKLGEGYNTEEDTPTPPKLDEGRNTEEGPQASEEDAGASAYRPASLDITEAADEHSEDSEEGGVSPL
jgi:hypothetical protein